MGRKIRGTCFVSSMKEVQSLCTNLSLSVDIFPRPRPSGAVSATILLAYLMKWVKAPYVFFVCTYALRSVVRLAKLYTLTCFSSYIPHFNMLIRYRGMRLADASQKIKAIRRFNLPNDWKMWVSACSPLMEIGLDKRRAMLIVSGVQFRSLDGTTK